MVSFSAPVTGGRFNSNNLSGSVMSIVLAMAGVMLMFVVFFGGRTLFGALGNVPLIGRAAPQGAAGIPVNRVAG